jgi:hypothetical protein
MIAHHLALKAVVALVSAGKANTRQVSMPLQILLNFKITEAGDAKRSFMTDWAPLETLRIFLNLLERNTRSFLDNDFSPSLAKVLAIF